MDLDKSVDLFFTGLLADTDRQFKQSPIYKKQLTLNKQWNYAICATPISKGNGVLFGINWGGKESGNFPPQTKMPTFENISKEVSTYHFITHSKQYLENHWGLNIASINFNYSNLCFFRTPKEKDLSADDYKLSLPLFEKYIRYINPPWILSIGGTNIKMLDSLGALKNIREHFDKQGKFKGHSGQLWNWNIYSVPHPIARLTSDARQSIWTKVTAEMKKATNH